MVLPSGNRYYKKLDIACGEVDILQSQIAISSMPLNVLPTRFATITLYRLLLTA
jgi:hypothetical protein